MQDNSRTVAIATTLAACPLGFSTVLVQTQVHLRLYNQWWKDFWMFLSHGNSEDIHYSDLLFTYFMYVYALCGSRLKEALDVSHHCWCCSPQTAPRTLDTLGKCSSHSTAFGFLAASKVWIHVQCLKRVCALGRCRVWVYVQCLKCVCALGRWWVWIHVKCLKICVCTRKMAKAGVQVWSPKPM